MNNIARIGRVGLFLTIRSLTRGNIGTTIMTIFMMAMIFVNLIFLTSIINGLVVTAHKQIIETLTGEILVEAPSESMYIERSSDVADQLLRVPGVEKLSAHTNFSAQLEKEGEQGSYRGVAIDPEAEKEVTTIEQAIIAGRYLEPDDTNAIILGIQIAGGEDVELYAYSLKDVSVGDTVFLSYANGLEKEYEVVGIFDNNFVQADNRFFITNHEYTSLFPELRTNASEFALRIQPTKDVEVVAQDIHDLEITDNVRTWIDTAGIVESFTKSFDIVNFIVSIVAIIVGGITIFIVMYIDVVNRKRQIGILRAIGISENSIALSYVLRALLYALCGVTVGILISKFILIPLFTQKPLQLPVGNVSLALHNEVMYVRALALLLVSFLGAFIPVQRALRMKIIDAIWGK